MEPKQIKIRLTADQGHVADALRELAGYIENLDSDNGEDYPRQFESDICMAEITGED